jgi:hypothetical protein
MITEGAHGRTIGWHGMIAEEAGDDLPQPLPLFRDRLMHALLHFLCDFLKLCPHAILPGLPLQAEVACSGLAADEGKAKKVEGFRFSNPAPGTSGRREAAKLDQASFVRVQRQRERLQPLTHRLLEASGIGLMLKTDHDIIGIPHDDHVALGVAPSPALGPELEHVVQVDVRQQR